MVIVVKNNMLSYAKLDPLCTENICMKERSFSRRAITKENKVQKYKKDLQESSLKQGNKGDYLCICTKQLQVSLHPYDVSYRK